MRYEGLLTNDLYLPFFNVQLAPCNWIVYLVFAAFVIVGCVNAVNLTDGIDGLAGSVTCRGLRVLHCQRRLLVELHGRLGLFASGPSGRAAGLFGAITTTPPRCFMGDTGSLFLGGAVAAMAFAFGYASDSDPRGHRIHCWRLCRILSR